MNKRTRKGNRDIQDAARELGHTLAEECPTPEVLKLSGAALSSKEDVVKYVKAALWSLPAELSVSLKASSLVEEIKQFNQAETSELESSSTS